MPDIPEDYYYSSLEAEEIEDRLLHMVPYNKSLSLTDDEKAVFRANIGAGTNNTGLIILGFFETLEEMQESLTTLPKAGDPYGIMHIEYEATQDATPQAGKTYYTRSIVEGRIVYTKFEGETFETGVTYFERIVSATYDIYIYDGYHKVWINNGPLNPGNVTFDDNAISSSKGWSSNKINSEFLSVRAAKQNLIDVEGILKSDGSGDVSAAVAGTDYISPETNYSPIHALTEASYSLTSDDIGLTFAPAYEIRTTPVTIYLAQAASTNIPNGTEIAILNSFRSSVTISTVGVKIAIPGYIDTEDGCTTTESHSFIAADSNSLLALKKIRSDANGDCWLLTGNVEVVS